MSSNPMSNGVRQSNIEPELTQEAYALLAQANLQRIRGNWLEATEMCMSAMRLVPGNVAAQSLLGDIYENQGCVDDAIQWYRMALDANPNSPADQQKLQRLLELKNNTTTYFDNSHNVAQDIPKTSVKDGSRTLKYFAYSSAFIVLAIILLSVIQTRAQYMNNRNSANKSKNINTNPFYINASPPDTEAVAKVNAVKDAGELALSNAIRQAEIPDAGSRFKFVDAETDPRLGRLTLTYIYTHYPDETVTKDNLLRQSLRVIQSVKKMQETSSYAYITMRVLLGDYNGNIQTAFIGDITRTDLVNYAAEPASYSPEQVSAAFSNQWWYNGIN